MGPFDGGDILGLAALLGTTLIGLLNFSKDKKKTDVDADTTKAATEIALDESSVKQALQLRDEALKERKEAKQEVVRAKEEADQHVEKVKQDLQAEFKKSISNVQSRITHLENELIKTKNTWRYWAQDLHLRWDHHRQSPYPPALPPDDGQDFPQEV